VTSPLLAPTGFLALSWFLSCFLSVWIPIVNAQKSDPHRGELGSQCESCHTVEGWKPSTFTVERHQQIDFKLEGKHFDVACVKCHIDGRYKNIGSRCFDCHATTDGQTGHKGELGESCENCHTVVDWRQTTFAQERHNQLTFKLIGKHANVECAKCHANNRFRGMGQSCFSCHQKDDAHKSELGSNCESCHVVDGWKLSTFTVERHQQIAFTLEGKHKTVACAQCHIKGQYKGLETTCYGCHHRADERIHKGELGRACESCHTNEAWKPSTFDHAERDITRAVRNPWRQAFAWLLPEKMTPKDRVITYRYELTGGHADLACAQCHVNHKYKHLDTTCVSCHQRIDPHAGRLGSRCEGCHSTNGWAMK